MKKNDWPRRTGWAAMGWLACGASLWAADGPIRYQSPPRSSQVLIQGTSSLHPWEMKGVIIGGFAEFAAPVDFDTSQTTLAGLHEGLLPITVQAIIPVSAMKSEAEIKPEYMERLMLEAMKATNFTRIEYHTTELKLKQPHTPGTAFEFEAKGELAIAGVTNKVEFPVTIAPAGAGQIKISGEAKVKMTDYGVKPPAPDFGLGLMRCGDEVKIIFEWLLVKKRP